MSYTLFPAVAKINLQRTFCRILFVMAMILVFMGTTSGRMAAHALAATISLTSCKTTALVNAIQQANATGEADVISLKPGCTYSLLGVNNNGADGPNGLPIIVSDLAVNGNGATILRDMAGGAPPFRILQVASGHSLTLNHVVLKGGMATADGGAILNGNGTLTVRDSSFLENRSGLGAKGGAIANSNFGTLDVSDSSFDGNSSSYGGAIYDFGPMTIARSQFTHNSTNLGGGAVYIDGGATSVADSQFIGNHADNNGGGITYYSPLQLTLTRSIFSGNTAHGGGAYFDSGALMVIDSSSFQDNHANYGGAGYIAAPSNITASTFSGNVATLQGGALYHSYGPVVLANVTLAGNSAANDGGAIHNAGNTVTAINSTIAGNSAGSNGGGLYNTSDYAGTVILENTIVANNSGGNCFNAGTLTDGGGNLRFPVGDPSCIGTYGDPKLEPLQNNSGIVETMAFQVNSAALDAGDDSICNDAPVNVQDARGLARPQGGHCDIGAFEMGPAADLEVGLTDNPDPVALAGNLTYSISIKNNGPTAAQNVVIENVLPANTTFQSLIATGWSCTTPPVDGTGTVSCSKSAFANAQQETLTLVVKVSSFPSATMLDNSATVGADTPDLGPHLNSAATTTCVGLPPSPTLLLPKKGATVKSKVTLAWTDVPCVQTFNLTIRQDSKHGTPFKRLSGLSAPNSLIKGLTSGKTYYWYSEACNSLGCTRSLWSKFKVQ